MHGWLVDRDGKKIVEFPPGPDIISLGDVLRASGVTLKVRSRVLRFAFFVLSFWRVWNVCLMLLFIFAKEVEIVQPYFS